MKPITQSMFSKSAKPQAAYGETLPLEKQSIPTSETDPFPQDLKKDVNNLESAETKTSTNSSTTFPTSQDKIQEKVLRLKIEYMNNLNSPKRSIFYQAQRYTNIFQQPYALRRNNRWSIKSKQYLDSTKDTLCLSQSYGSCINASPDQSMFSSLSVERQKNKKNNELRFIINDFNFNFMKHSFRHYYDQYINLRVLVEQECDKTKCFQPLVANRGRYDEKTEFKKDHIMYPPPYDTRDFEYFPQLLIFKLKNMRFENIYKSPKSKNMIFLKIPITQLINIFYKQLPELFANFGKSLAQMKTNIRLVVSKNPKIDKTKDYETLELLVQVAETTYEEVMKNEIKEMQQIREHCKQKLIAFIQKLTFYNFTMCVYEHYKKNQFNIKYYKAARLVPKKRLFDKVLEDKRLLFQKIQSRRQSMMVSTMRQVQTHTDIKRDFFLASWNNPRLLYRIFQQSITDDPNAKNSLQIMGNYEYTIQNFYNRLHKIQEEELKIFFLSKYMIHYIQYCLQVVNAMTSPEAPSIENTYNAVRFIVQFFVSVFVKKAINRIEREIRFCYGPYVADKVRKLNLESTRYQESLAKLEKCIKSSYTKISSYLADTSGKSVNIDKIKSYKKIDPLKGQQKPGMIDLIQTLYEENANQKILSPNEDTEQMILIYRYIIKLTSTEYFCQKNLERCFKKMIEKHFREKVISYEDFLASNAIEHGRTTIQKFEEFEKCMKEFEKQYKIVRIEMLQLYLMLTTLWCYSFSVEEEGQRIRNQEKSRNAEESQKKLQKLTFKQLLINLDLAYIIQSTKVTSVNLKAQNIIKINQMLKIYTKFGLLINDLFKSIGEKQNFEVNAMKNLLDPLRQTSRVVVVPVHNNTVSYQQDQQMKMEKKQAQLRLQKSWSILLSDKLCDESTSGAPQRIQDETKVMDLNKLMDRKLHKDKLSIFGLEDSWRIGREIYKEFILAGSVMKSDEIRRNLTITYAYKEKEGKLHQSPSLASTKSSSTISPKPQSLRNNIKQ